MRNLLFLLVFIPFMLTAQKYEYNVVTDLDNECNCNSSIKIKENKVIVKYKGLRKKLKIKNKEYIENKNLYILYLDSNKYDIEKIIVCETISIITYNDKSKREVQFLNIYGRREKN